MTLLLPEMFSSSDSSSKSDDEDDKKQEKKKGNDFSKQRKDWESKKPRQRYQQEQNQKEVSLYKTILISSIVSR